LIIVEPILVKLIDAISSRPRRGRGRGRKFFRNFYQPP